MAGALPQVEMVVTYDDVAAAGELCSLNFCDSDNVVCSTSRGQPRAGAHLFHSLSTSSRTRRRLADAQTPSFTRPLPPAVVISDHSRDDSDVTPPSPSIGSYQSTAPCMQVLAL